jgi:hypothetical protein
MITQTKTTLFNSAVELGLRSLCVLVETYPRISDLQRLVLFDYMLVHSADVDGGPESLHPATPQRGTEILVRRAIIEPGLSLFSRRDLICITAEGDGFAYSASDRGAAFLDSLRAEYVKMLRERAHWIAGAFGGLPTREIQLFVNTELDRWGGQFAHRSSERGAS